MKRILFLMLLIISGNVLGSSVQDTLQSWKKNSPFYYRNYFTQRLAGEKPHIDGKLDDACWQEGQWSDEFTQYAPNEGAKASQRTVLKVLYDDKNIYVAFRAYETEMKKMHRYIGKRDDYATQGDAVGICLDSYNDHRTGFEFDVTCGGVQMDLLLNNDLVTDLSWNAVWYSATALEDSAWTAEMQIPLSQLRYSDEPEQVWGMHAWRWIDRYTEEDQWSVIPRMNSGFIHNFGKLKGIKDLKKLKRIEIMPYTMGQTKFSQREQGNPFTKGYDNKATAGFDGRLGLGSNFTLDMTVNPDFGQVEADPSVMNLTAFETYYDEKRPFFLQGKSIFQYNLDDAQLYYSRRIGHAPIYKPDLNSGEFAKAPEITSILDAVKISGQTSDGLSIGLMQSLTLPEYVTIASGNDQYKRVAEPMANYTVGRIQKDFDKGTTSVGGIFTATNRSFDQDYLSFIDKSAYTGGIDFVRYFKNRTYSFNAKAIGSYIEGEPKAITELQKSSARYFQRPDAGYLKLDTNRTSLSGNGGLISFARAGESKLRFMERIYWRSPGLELNDIGFMQNVDLIQQYAYVQYIETKPKDWYRTYYILVYDKTNWDFGGRYLNHITGAELLCTFANVWTIDAGYDKAFTANDNRLLRGGPTIKIEPYQGVWLYAETNPSKKIYASIFTNYYVSSDGFSNVANLKPGITVRLSSKFNVGLSVEYIKSFIDYQYVNTYTVANNTNYVLGRIKQHTLDFVVRSNYNITSKISILYYGSPFVSIGKFSNLRKVTDPMNVTVQKRYTYYQPNQFMVNGEKLFITDGNAIALDNPDFSMHEFRSNLVARWEYHPGSVLYLVWSHQQSKTIKEYQPDMNNNFNSLFEIYPQDVFLVKLNYYFSL